MQFYFRLMNLNDIRFKGLVLVSCFYYASVPTTAVARHYVFWVVHPSACSIPVDVISQECLEGITLNLTQTTAQT